MRSAPAFPPFEQWQAMSEAEQDALISRIEMAQRRKRNLTRLLAGLACAAAAAAGIAAALSAQLLG